MMSYIRLIVTVSFEKLFMFIRDLRVWDRWGGDYEINIYLILHFFKLFII